MKALQTINLSPSMSSQNGLAWSTEARLATATSEGVYIFELTPNPCCTLGKLNFHRSLIPPGDESVPWQLDIRLEGNSEYEELTFSERQNLVWSKSNPSLVTFIQWTPKGAIVPEQSSLVTLTVNHRLRIFTGSLSTWEEHTDVSALLKVQVNQLQPRNPPDLKQLGVKLRNLATTSFVWSEIRQQTSLLITGQKSGLLSVWKCRTNEGLSFDRFFDAGVGFVSNLVWHPMTADSFLVLVGGLTGQLKALRFKWEGDDVSIEDIGFIWSEADDDAVGPGFVITMADPRMRLIFSKGMFVLVADVDFDRTPRIVALKAFPMAMSSIVDIQLTQTEEVVVMGQLGKPAKIVLHEDVTKCEVQEYPMEIDHKNYSCHGFKLSHGKKICAVLQNINVYHDHLILRTPGRITFQTSCDLDTLSKDLFTDPVVRRSVDALEVFRVLSLLDEDRNTKGMLDLIDKLFTSFRDDPSRRQMCIWLCQLYVNLSEDEATVDAVSEKCETVAKDLMISHASAMINNVTADNEIRSLKSFGTDLDHRDWKCCLCEGSVVETAVSFVRCSSGHTWPRCVLSLQACEAASVSKCLWCEAVARPEISRRVNECTICSGPLVITN